MNTLKRLISRKVVGYGSWKIWIEHRWKSSRMVEACKGFRLSWYIWIEGKLIGSIYWDECVSWLVWYIPPSLFQFATMRLALISTGCVVTPSNCKLNLWKNLFTRWLNLPHNCHWGLLFPNPLPLPLSLPYPVVLAWKSGVICCWFWWLCPSSGGLVCTIYVRLEFILTCPAVCVSWQLSQQILILYCQTPNPSV